MIFYIIIGNVDCLVPWDAWLILLLVRYNVNHKDSFRHSGAMGKSINNANSWSMTGILRDKTMDDKLIYIPNDDNHNNPVPLCKIIIVFKKHWIIKSCLSKRFPGECVHITLVTSIIYSQMSPSSEFYKKYLIVDIKSLYPWILRITDRKIHKYFYV